jgi:signal transduction histidine kinase
MTNGSKGSGRIARRAGDWITAFTRTAPMPAAGVIFSLIAVGWVSIYLGGGTRHIPSHWFYIPILLAAVRFGLKGATGTAIVSAFVAGPLLPAEVAQGLQQPMAGVIYRGVYFVLMGLFMAGIIVRLEDSLYKEVQLATHEAKVSRQEAELAAHQAAVVSTVSHEFRSPLSVLLGTAKMLSDVEWSGFERTVVDGITTSARRLNDLVAAVLAVSEGPLTAEQEVSEIHLREVCFGVQEGLEYGMRERVNIEVTNVVLRTNPAILQGLVRQLVDNALKFSPAGSTVEISAWGSQEDNLYIGVSDHGSGIDQAFLPQAFGAFTQQDESMTREVGGLGIGLFVAHRLAQCLHADVELRPRAGGGTEAVVILPGSVLPPYPDEDLFDLRAEASLTQPL